MSEKGTEAATEQRKSKARQKGDIVRSRELLSAAAMLAGLLTLNTAVKPFLYAWNEVFARSLRLGTADVHVEGLDRAVLKILAPALLPAGVILAASFGVALFVGVAQSGGLQFNANALSLKFERLNPVTNLGNLFSMRSLTRLAKSLVPASVIVWLAARTLHESVLPMPVTSLMRLPATLAACFNLALDAAWLSVAWSAVDYLMELQAWNKKLRMSKQEMRDEMKETMGNPQIKGRIRQVQNAMRRRKVKADVSRASVVITNPTHYAVALEFSFELMQAPTVLVKGKNLHASRIREEARWAGVPIVENPPLARSLYKSVPEGQSIPFELYAAVAGILAFLYRQQVEKAARDRKMSEDTAGQRTQTGPTMATGGI